ncbi:Chain length determinant protein EpsF [Candidatus Methylobacter favarea]|uniref:Chain length determinant protein EpsF n=1 Tax=Candidatus Methylobacter favarea TaxID=2707345 RepID=A0A8S0XIK8_9GAMM|nr:chain length determinant protein EpsF [Candidatus Methylobacter favarea]CAA9892543.1 Chain length determinant protein EpsF [Candidatus Methylobacter favarea]
MSLQQLFIILWCRKILIIACLSVTVVTALIASLLMAKQYVATTTLVLDQRGIDPITGSVLPTPLLTGYMATQMDVIKSHNVALKVVNALKLAENKQTQTAFEESKQSGDIRDWLADSLLQKLEVIPSKESSIIHITFSAKDPELSARTVNAFAQAYIQTTVELKVQPAKQNADWFEIQLASLRQQMEDAYEKLSAFQQEHGIVMTKDSDHLDLEDARLSEIARQLVESQGRTYELISRKNQLAEALAGKESFESLQEILTNSFVQQLKADLARAEAKFAELAERVDRKHPEYLQAQAEVTSLRKKIKSEISTVLNGISSSVAASKQHDNSLAASLAEQKSKVLELKKQHDQIAVLDRQVENTRKAYDTAMQRAVQTRMESETNQTNIALLNPALPPKYASKPNVKLNLLLSAILGFILGTGIALIIELFDRRIRSATDITESLGLPVFGIVQSPQQHKKLLGPWRLAKGALS